MTEPTFDPRAYGRPVEATPAFDPRAFGKPVDDEDKDKIDPATNQRIVISRAIDETAAEYKVRPPEVLRTLWREGLAEPAAGVYQAGANLTGMTARVMEKVNTALEGRKTKGIHNAVQAVSDFLQAQATGLRKSGEPSEEGKLSPTGEAVEGTIGTLASMPYEALKTGAAVAVGGASKAGAAVGSAIYRGLEAVDQGPVQALIAGGMGYGSGAVLRRSSRFRDYPGE